MTPNHPGQRQLRATQAANPPGVFQPWAFRQSSSTLCGVCHEQQTPSCLWLHPSSAFIPSILALLAPQAACTQTAGGADTPVPTTPHSTATFSFVLQGLATMGLLSTPQAPEKCIPLSHWGVTALLTPDQLEETQHTDLPASPHNRL